MIPQTSKALTSAPTCDASAENQCSRATAGLAQGAFVVLPLNTTSPFTRSASSTSQTGAHPKRIPQSPSTGWSPFRHLPPSRTTTIRQIKGHQDFPGGSIDKEYACSVGDLGLIPRLGRSPGEGNSNPLQYSGLENSMDCIVHGVAESDTTEWLNWTELNWMGFPGGSVGKESACNEGDLGPIPGLGRSPGEGNSNPLQYSGLENSMNPWAHRVTMSRTEWLFTHLRAF